MSNSEKDYKIHIFKVTTKIKEGFETIEYFFKVIKNKFRKIKINFWK